MSRFTGRLSVRVEWRSIPKTIVLPQIKIEVPVAKWRGKLSMQCQRINVRMIPRYLGEIPAWFADNSNSNKGNIVSKWICACFCVCECVCWHSFTKIKLSEGTMQNVDLSARLLFGKYRFVYGTIHSERWTYTMPTWITQVLPESHRKLCGR